MKVGDILVSEGRVFLVARISKGYAISPEGSMYLLESCKPAAPVEVAKWKVEHVKWFGDKAFPEDTEGKARAAIEYLKKSGDRPERWSAQKQLLIFIAKKVLDNAILKDIVALKNDKLSAKVAIYADEEVLTAILDSGLLEQSVFAIMMYNKNFTEEHAKRILPLCDDSPRGITNRKILEKREGNARTT